MAVKKNVSDFLGEEKEGGMEEGISSATPGTAGDAQGEAYGAGTSSATPGDTLYEVTGASFTYLKSSKYVAIICFLGEGETSGATNLEELDLDHEGDVAEKEGVADLTGEGSKMLSEKICYRSLLLTFPRLTSFLNHLFL